jgi:hypothetical protein
MQGGNAYEAFNSKCLAIVRGLGGQPGTITLRVKSKSGPNDPTGFKGATIKITAK